MEGLIEKYELVKETHYIFDNDTPKIKGRIYKILKGPNAKFMWTINMYCRLSEEMDYYVPSGPFGLSLEEIEHKLEGYVKRFAKAEDWKENKHF